MMISSWISVEIDQPLRVRFASRLSMSSRKILSTARETTLASFYFRNVLPFLNSRTTMRLRALATSRSTYGYLRPSNFKKLRKARSRLYRGRPLQINTHFAAFFEFYEFCTLLNGSIQKNQKIVIPEGERESTENGGTTAGARQLCRADVVPDEGDRDRDHDRAEHRDDLHERFTTRL